MLSASRLSIFLAMALVLSCAGHDEAGSPRRKVTFGFPGNNAPTDFVGLSENGTVTLKGFTVDMMHLVCEACGLDCHAVLAEYETCWNNGYAGRGILGQAYFDACSGFYDTDERRLAVAFSEPLLRRETAGLLTRLNQTTGEPAVLPSDNLTGRVVSLVGGWSTTALAFSQTQNACTDAKFSGFRTVTPYDLHSGPDEALRALLAGQADVLFVEEGIISDRVNCAEEDTTCDAALWKGLGTDFVWIHQGLEYLHDGVTLAMVDKRSELLPELNRAILNVTKSAEYAELCRQFPSITAKCLPNDHLNVTLNATAENATAAGVTASNGGSFEGGVVACDL